MDIDLGVKSLKRQRLLLEFGQRKTMYRHLVLYPLGLLVLCFTHLEVRAQDTAHVATAYNEMGNWDIYVLDTDTGQTIYQLTSPDMECPIELSADGHWMVYSVGDSPTTSTFNLVNLESHATVNLRSRIESTAFSEDGHFLAYEVIDEQRKRYLYIYDTTSAEEWFIDEIGFKLDSQIIFHWVGNVLVYTFQSGTTMYLRHVEANDIRTQTIAIPEKLVDLHLASISPDGSSLALTTTENELSQIYVFNTVTSEWVRVTELDTGGLSHDWSPDGRYLAFVTVFDPTRSIQQDSGDIYLWDSLDRTSSLFNDSSYTRNEHIRWSPDGQYIFYREWLPGGTHDARYNLFVKDVYTGESQEISDFVDMWGGDMRWVSSTELVYLYAHSELPFGSPEQQNDLYRYDVTTHESVRLTETPGNEDFRCAYG